MKVLFLDIDGVLNSRQGVLWHKRVKGLKGSIFIDHRFWDPLAANNLLYILDKLPELKIVISSTWRVMHSMQEMKNFLEPLGVKPNKIIDFTPDLGAVERGLEIQKWLDDHPEVKEFVILDDNSDMAHLKHKLVKTDEWHGLTLRDAVAALTMLKHRNPTQ